MDHIIILGMLSNILAILGTAHWFYNTTKSDDKSGIIAAAALASVWFWIPWLFALPATLYFVFRNKNAQHFGLKVVYGVLILSIISYACYALHSVIFTQGG